MARAEPKANIQNRPHRQQGELDALEQAEGTRKLVQQQLRRKGDQEDQRDSEEAERIEGNGEWAGHGRALEWQLQHVAGVVQIGRDAGEKREGKQCKGDRPCAPPGDGHYDKDGQKQRGEFHRCAPNWRRILDEPRSRAILNA